MSVRKQLASGLAVLALGAMVVACSDDDDAQGDDSSQSASDETDTAAAVDGASGGDTEATSDIEGCAVDLGIPELGASDTGTASGSTAADPMTSGYGSVTIDGGPLMPYGAVEGDDPAIGCPAPALTGASYEGEPTSFTPGQDGPTLLVFLAHWCPHCNREVPMMLQWDEAGSTPQNLNIIGVSTGISDIKPHFPPGQWIEDVKWPWPVIADTEPPDGLDTDLGDAGITYGATSFPFLTLVDADGQVVARHAGELDPDQLTEFVSQVE